MPKPHNQLQQSVCSTHLGLRVAVGTGDAEAVDRAVGVQDREDSVRARVAVKVAVRIPGTVSVREPRSEYVRRTAVGVADGVGVGALLVNVSFGVAELRRGAVQEPPAAGGPSVALAQARQTLQDCTRPLSTSNESRPE